MDHPRRWIVAGGLLLTATAIAVQFWHRSTDDEQVAMAAPVAVAPTSASEPPPASVSPTASEPAPAMPVAVTARTSSASTASGAASEVKSHKTPSFTPPTMQNFGQIVLIGMHGGTPKQAGEAANVLQICLEASLYDLSGHARRSSPQDERRSSRIAAAEWLESQCKSITPEMQAERGALAGRAVEAGLDGVSMIYGRSVGYRPPEAMRDRLLDAMKTDFRAGDRHMPDELGFNGMKLGLSRTEARAYLLVALLESPQEIRSLREMVFQEGPFRDMSDEEIREAEALAERLKQERTPPKRRNG